MTKGIAQHTILIFSFWVMTLFTRVALAEVSVGLNFAYLQEQNSLSSKSLKQTTITDLYLYVQAGRTSSLSFGLDYFLISTTGPSPTDDSSHLFSSTSPMASVKYAPGKRKLYSLVLSYGPIVQATFQSTGNTADLWTGTATAVKLNAEPEIYDQLYLSLTLLYFSASYTSKSQNSGSSDVTSLTRTVISPLIGLRLDF